MTPVRTIEELLTPLDRRVLEEVPAEPDLTGHPHAIAARAIQRSGRRSPPLPDELREIEEILRGLEATGFAHLVGGRWCRVPGR